MAGQVWPVLAGFGILWPVLAGVLGFPKPAKIGHGGDGERMAHCKWRIAEAIAEIGNGRERTQRTQRGRARQSRNQREQIITAEYAEYAEKGLLRVHKKSSRK